MCVKTGSLGYYCGQQHDYTMELLGHTLGLRMFMVVRLPILVWERASVCRITDLPPPVCPTTMTVCLVIRTCKTQGSAALSMFILLPVHIAWEVTASIPV